MIPYGAAKKLKRGILLKIYPTMVCNLDCSYCGNKLGIGLDNHRFGSRLSVDEWLKIIDNFPMKVKEVHLTGGEPSTYKGFVDLVNALLERGIFVTIFTNLKLTSKFLKIKPSNKLLLYSSFHSEQMSVEEYSKSFYTLTFYHRIVVKELGQKLLPFSRLVPWGCTADGAKKIRKNCLYIAPDGQLFTTCFGVMNYTDLKEKGNI